MDGLHEVAGQAGKPEALKANQLNVEFASGSNKILGLWAGDKGDNRKVVLNKGVQFPGDGNDYTMEPTDKYVGADTSSSTAEITLPDVSLIEDGHEVIIEDDGGNATNNNVSIATNGSETVDTGSLTSNDTKARLIWDVENTNWKDVT